MENHRHGEASTSAQNAAQDSEQPILSAHEAAAEECRSSSIWMMGLALLAFAVHAPGILAGFVFDDMVTIEHRSDMNWLHIPSFFTTNSSAFFGSNFYRPVLQSWCEVTYGLFGAHAPAWHVISILLHVACTLLVFLLALRLVEDRFIAGVAAALFAVHPAHVEAISWASAMGDLLVTAFMLLSVLAFLHWMEQGNLGWWAASFAAATACIFTKETAVLLPLLLLVTALALGSRHAQAAGGASLAAYPAPANPVSLGARPGLPVLAATIPFFAISLVFLGLRQHTLKAFSHPLSPFSTAEMIFTWPSALCFYLHHMFWPSAVVPFYPVSPVTSWQSPEFFLPLIGLLAATGGLGYLLWRSAGWRKLCICLAWILVPLAPVMYLKALAPFELVHDRFLYAPLVGFCIAVALILGWVTDRIESRVHWRGYPMIAVVLVLVMSIESLSQIVWWQNNRTLFTRALTVTPDNPKALTGLAQAYMGTGNYDKAVPLLQRALAIDPRQSTALFCLGRIAWLQGDDAGAENFLTQALSIQPTYDMWLHLASVEMHRNQPDAAEAAVRQSLVMNPNGGGAHAALGTVLLAKGDQAGAAREFQEELRIFPQSEVAQIGLAQATAKAPR